MPLAPKRPPPVRRLYQQDSGFLGDKKDIDSFILRINRYLDSSTSEYSSCSGSILFIDNDNHMSVDNAVNEFNDNHVEDMSVDNSNANVPNVHMDTPSPRNYYPPSPKRCRLFE